ncbi:MAG: GLPGLI family protein [Tannerellaceae bacterium]|jgi:GLPGLI family protein|nr:GLPGLI family protein [Tannerellaceae bacterium]
MKRMFIFLCMGMVLCAGATAQVINVVDPNEVMKAEPIDEVRFVVQYELTSVPDTLNPDKTESETMMLKVGDKSSQYYSYNRFVTDSIFREKLRTSGRIVKQQASDSNPGRQTARIYKNYPSGKTTTLDQIVMSRFRCEEENEIPQWELLPDTATLLSYPCQKAVCRFKGRDYEAWFTTEIPRGEGPWKLQGLPGLILKASDTQGHYRFECTGIIRPQAGDMLMFGADNYQPVSRKDLNTAYKRYAADPLGYVTATAPNVKVTIMNESGEVQKPKDTPFNPIERN